MPKIAHPEITQNFVISRRYIIKIRVRLCIELIIYLLLKELDIFCVFVGIKYMLKLTPLTQLAKHGKMSHLQTRQNFAISHETIF